MTKKPPLQAILATTRLVADLDQIIASAAEAESLWKVSRLKESDVGAISTNAGVYCFVLPEIALPRKRRLILYGRTFGKKGARRQLQTSFEYHPKKFARGEDLVVYVGKAANIHARIKGHLSVNTKATTNQVLRGLAAQSRRKPTQVELSRARKRLQKLGSVYYHEHFHENESKADYRTAMKIG